MVNVISVYLSRVKVGMTIEPPVHSNPQAGRAMPQIQFLLLGSQWATCYDPSLAILLSCHRRKNEMINQRHPPEHAVAGSISCRMFTDTALPVGSFQVCVSWTHILSLLLAPGANYKHR